MAKKKATGKRKPRKQSRAAAAKKRSARKKSTPPAKAQQSAEVSAYAAKKAQAAERERAQSREGREIGPLPKPENLKRRNGCSHDLGKFLKTYFPGTFKHPWSSVHSRLITLIEMVVLTGALLAIGIPRGWGKTSICVRAVIWAIAYRHHVFVMLIGAANESAKALIADIRAELEMNELLQQDFPEICLPIAALEGVNQRGKAQLCGGKRTRVFASDFELRLGDVGGQSGGIIRAGGILSSKIRGARHVVDGTVLRPTLGLVDDPQTEASAASKRSCYRRERVIQAALPGLPGAGEAWSCLMTMTVIEPDDTADRVLNRDVHPDWHGVRHAALEALPNDDAMELWFEWNRIREECLRADQPLDRAHAYYRKHKRKMNAGCKVVWKHGYDPDRFVDPLEQSMDWYFRDRQGFWSELMNNPAGFEPEGRPLLDRAAVAGRISATKRNEIPQKAEFITAAADVQGKCLFYEVRAHATDSTSWIIDYGTWPGQPRQYFTLNDIKLTLDSAYPKHATLQARHTVAIKDLFNLLFDRSWTREDGQVMRLNVAGCDANWETETVKAAIQASGLSGRLLPCHGRSFRPPKTSINDLSEKEGDRCGGYWRLRMPKANQQRHLLFDVDFWKSHHRDRLLIPEEVVGACVLHGGRTHEMYADHMLAEVSSIIHDVSSQRTVETWEHKPERPDNHFLDTSVINSVLGAMLGCQLPDAESIVTERRATRRRRRRRRGKAGPVF